MHKSLETQVALGLEEGRLDATTMNPRTGMLNLSPSSPTGGSAPDRSLRSLRIVTLACLPALWITGCAGYRLGTEKPAQYASVQNIHVPTFKNDTLEPRLAVIATNAVITQLQQDGTYTVTDRDQADAVLVGTIKRTDRFQQRSTNNDILRTRELVERIQIDWFLEDPRTGARIRADDPFSEDVNQRDSVTGQRSNPSRTIGQTTVFLDENFQLSERQGLVLAAEDAAQQIVSYLSDGW